MILTLHSIDESGSVISYSAAALRRLCGAIVGSKWQLRTVRQILEEPRAGCIALSFDDGMASVVEVAAPVLAEYGAPATLFVTTGALGGTNRWPTQSPLAPTMPMMSWDDVGRLAAGGWEIGAHTHSHPDLRRLDDDGLVEELERPLERLKARLGVDPSGFAYPYGYFDERVRRAVAQRYGYAVSTNLGDLSGTIDRYVVPRVDAYYLRGRWWGHATALRACLAPYARLVGAWRRFRRHEGEIHGSWLAGGLGRER